MQYGKMTSPRKLNINDKVQIKTGPFAGQQGIVRSATPRSILMTGCWTYVVEFTGTNGQKKKKYFPEYDLQFMNV